MTGPSGVDLDIEIERERLRLAKPPPVAPTLDRYSGAPTKTRIAVGSAVTPQDRLATIRKDFPDAQPEGTDNFIYTDPKSKRPTLYNEKGLSWGDVASVLPEIGEFIGGAAGGAATVAAAPATGGTSLVAAPVAVGAGALAGRETVRGVAQWALGSQETRSIPEQAADQATTFATNAVAGPLGEKIVAGAKAVLGPAVRYFGGKLTNQNTLGAFNRSGIAPQAGAVTGNRIIQSAEQGFYNTPGGAGVMQESFDRTLDDASKQATSIAEDLGSGAGRNRVAPVQSTEGAGATLKQGASNAGDKFAADREVLDTAAVNLIGADRPTQLTTVQTVLTDLQAQLSRAPNSRPELQRAITEAQHIIDDAAAQGDSLPFEVLRKIRTRIGRELDSPDVSGYRPGEDSHMSRLYGALKEDLYGAARTAGPNAEAALKKHDDFVTLFRSTAGGKVPAASVLQKVVDSKSDAAALNYALEGSKDSTQRLAMLRSQVTPEEWDVVSASVFHSLGRATPGAQGVSLLGSVADDFSIGTFMTNWSKLQTSGASNVLFGGPRYARLKGPIDDLVTVLGSLKDSAKMRNTSGTARSTTVATTMSALGAVSAGVAGGDMPTGAVGTLLGLTVGSYAGAKMLTSPRFVRWLAGASANLARDPNSWSQWASRLTGIAKAEPALRSEISRILDSSAMPPAAQPPKP
jgi:hypothetical protein